MAVIKLQERTSKKCREVECRKRIDQYRFELIKNKTEAEKVMMDILDDYDIKYEFQRIFKIKRMKYKIVDFYLPGYYVVIEVDGGYHKALEQVKKDFVREGQLVKKKGINRVIRFDNDEVINMPPVKIIQRINSYI